MSTSPQPFPANPTGQLAERLPGFDSAPTIAAGEHRLTDYLGMPTQQVLDELGLQQPPNQALAAPASPGLPANPGGAINPVDPTQLISPVINALGTLGTGQFSGTDPTQTFTGISNAVDSSASSLQPAMGSVAQDWQGASGTAATAKTAAALDNGHEVATQATGLQNSLSAAAADVAQARTQHIEIINEFMATLAAIGPMIIFPWGWAMVLAAAAKAVAHSAQVVTALQGSLGAQASNVSAIGAPVPVTAAPQLGASMIGPMSSLMGGPMGSMGGMSGMNMLSQLMYPASMGVSQAVSAATQAANRAASNSTKTGTLAGATAADPKSAAAGGSSPLKSAAHGGGGGGGTSPTSSHGTPVSRVAAPLPAASQATPTATPPSSARAATSGMAGMGGAGMMGAPLAGHGAGAGGAHTPASFLHTTDQGGKLVGGRSTVAPPVIGETDPNETPDIELRI